MKAVAESGPLAATVRYMDGTTPVERLESATSELRDLRARLREVRG